MLVLSEAVMVGALSGMISTGLAWLAVNEGLGGIKFPIAFFPKFMIRDSVLWLGPLLGIATSLIGSCSPRSACRVRRAMSSRRSVDFLPPLPFREGLGEGSCFRRAKNPPPAPP